jgi:hypothetical protein
VIKCHNEGSWWCGECKCKALPSVGAGTRTRTMKFKDGQIVKQAVVYVLYMSIASRAKLD